MTTACEILWKVHEGTDTVYDEANILDSVVSYILQEVRTTDYDLYKKILARLSATPITRYNELTTEECHE